MHAYLYRRELQHVRCLCPRQEVVVDESLSTGRVERGNVCLEVIRRADSDGEWVHGERSGCFIAWRAEWVHGERIREKSTGDGSWSIARMVSKFGSNYSCGPDPVRPLPSLLHANLDQRAPGFHLPWVPKIGLAPCAQCIRERGKGEVM